MLGTAKLGSLPALFWFSNGKGLNCYLCPLIYKMLMVPKVKQAISFGDWFATNDLKVIYCFPLRHLSCTLDLHVMHGRCPWFYEDTGPQGP